MTAYVLAIDNGSQSTKVSVVDAAGQVHATGRCALRPYATTPDGHVVHPDDDIWDSIAAACTEAMDRFAGDPREIAAVGLCTIRFCRALLDGRGRLVEPVMSWMDVRVSRPHDPTDRRVEHVTTSSGYVTHRLTGRFVDTRANYQGLWPIDQLTAEWSTDPIAYERTGMPRGLLLDLVSPGGLLGTVTTEAAAATGIPAGVPVFATANDKAVEALGCGLRDGDTVLLSLGTYIAAMTTGTSADGGGEDFWVNFGSTPGQYLYESHGIRRGMWTVSWFRDLVHGPDAHLSNRSLEEALDREAAAVPAGSGGLMAVLDWLPPTEAPYRRGALLGFDGTQGRGHVQRAILEGIVLTMHGHVKRMEQALGRRFSTVVVAGGGSRSDLMMQLVSDVFDRPARRTSMPDAAGLGAAICAAVGAGLHPDWDRAVTEMVGAGGEFAPRRAAVDTYAVVEQTYSRLREFTDPLFQHLDPARHPLPARA